MNVAGAHSKTTFAKLPPSLLATFHWVTGLTYWGEDVPGMKEFLEIWTW